jgi:hypothetical protein
VRRAARRTDVGAYRLNRFENSTDKRLSLTMAGSRFDQAKGIAASCAGNSGGLRPVSSSQGADGDDDGR